jgi:hypothetical protein
MDSPLIVYHLIYLLSVSNSMLVCGHTCSLPGDCKCAPAGNTAVPTPIKITGKLCTSKQGNDCLLVQINWRRLSVACVKTGFYSIFADSKRFLLIRVSGPS